MDLNSDGHVDILSGSYSRMEGDMAGLFQVLYGTEGGKFETAVPVNGTDGEPLIMDFGPNATEDQVDLDRICTRAYAVDLNADGFFDIVSGNFGGTFGVFMGTGKGAFSPETTPLMDAKGELLRVPMHSDPYFVDWDKDGDMDMLSGSTEAGVFIFTNVGTKEEPKFGKREALVEPAGMPDYGGPLKLGMDHLTKPTYATRVATGDVNGDGKLDLIVGDSCTYSLAKDGLSEDEVRERLAAWQAEHDEFVKSMPEITDYENMDEETEKAFEAFREGMDALREKKAKFIDERMAGFVWVYEQK